MIKKTAVSITAIVLYFMFSVASVSAQPATGMAKQAGVSDHHLMMSEMMKDMSKDMSQEMSMMTEQMSHGEPSPDQRKQMGQRMERMSKMMHRMSGLESRPAMKSPEMQKQMDQMRSQMDEMKRDSSMKSPAK